MRPTALQPVSLTNFGGSCCRRLVAATLLLLLLSHPVPSVAPCPPSCICASDIISCSGLNLSAVPSDLPGYITRLDLSHNAITVLSVGWMPGTFHKLVTLILSRNSVSLVEVNAFAVTPNLQHLDLSSNQLTVLDFDIFAGLKDLKELLLFENRIIQINPGALVGFRSLQRLYLSGNKLDDFPSWLYLKQGGLRNLSLLDVSYNRLLKVPVQNLLSLTQKSDIYLQGNPLTCECALLALLEYWMWKQYPPLVDFRSEYPCGDDSELTDCSQEVQPGVSLQVQTYQVEPGRGLRVACPGLTPLANTSAAVFWVTPRTVMNSSVFDPKARLNVFRNGTLEIRSALLEDSGTYACVTARRPQYDPKQFEVVDVVVGNSSTASASGLAHRGSTEHFNTAFTTLASCVVSIVLVLLYLYLTPCRCRDTRGDASRGCGGRAIVLCSDPREVEEGQRRANGKRVAFLEPREDNSDITFPKTPTVNSGPVATEGILKNGSRTVGQPLTELAQTE